MADNDVVLKDYAATPLSFNPRTIDRGSGIRENVQSLAKVDGTRINPATTEDIAAIVAATLKVILPPDQDPIFDHTNGVKVAVPATTSTLLITPPAGCKYVRINPDVDCFVNTANVAAGDLASSIKVLANSPEVVPVVAGTAVNVFVASAGTVRATPLKVR